jgi:3-oxoacyl-[acyl-carrier-protein] synthase III
MASFSLKGIELKGIAACVPKHQEHNLDYSRLTSSELKMLIKTTGVESRRVAPKGLTTSDLCFKATERLMNDLKWESSSIDLLIFVSQSRDYYLPSTSAILQNRLGFSQSCMSFDVGLGCSGFVYGLSIASSMLKATGMKRALILAGDVSSATCAYEDKSTYPLFGDAGTACAIENTGSDIESHFEHFTDGSGFRSIIIPDGGIRNLISEKSFIKNKHAEGIERSDLNVALDGIEVFNFSISKIPASVNSMNERLHRNAGNYDHFIMHQANLLMNETIRKKTGFDQTQVPYSLDQFGNTSSASIGLTMVSRIAERLRNKKLELLLSGFGVGLSWANAAITTENIVCPELLEL